MGKMNCLVVLFIWLINLGFGFGFGFGGVSGEKACNSTLGECFSYGGDMEFLGGEEAGDLLRHYTAGARWLLASAGGKAGNRAYQKKDPYCKKDQYGNCLKSSGSKTRSCPRYTYCKRADSGQQT